MTAADLRDVNTSTHYGRMVMTDDNTVMLFGNMDEMMEYIVEDCCEQCLAGAGCRPGQSGYALRRRQRRAS